MLGVNDYCTITITPGATATSDGTNPCSNGTVPTPDLIQFSADNSNTISTDVFILNYGCIYQGGYIYAFDDTTPNTSSVGGKVVTISDQTSASGIIWSSNGGTGGGGGGTDHADVSYDVIPGINEQSTSIVGSPTYEEFVTFFSNTYTNLNPFTSESFANCNGYLDGACNTQNILTFYNQFITNNTQGASGTPPFTASPGPTNITYYAAGLCRQTISNYSDWYLPSICEMGRGADKCIDPHTTLPVSQSIQYSLENTKPFIPYNIEYWSSTELSANNSNGAWSQVYTPSNGYGNWQNKVVEAAVRCSRVF